jgi:hypothetical protein
MITQRIQSELSLDHQADKLLRSKIERDLHRRAKVLTVLKFSAKEWLCDAKPRCKYKCYNRLDDEKRCDAT